MKQDLQNHLKDFATLKSKYKATKYPDSSPSSLLYLILRKFDLGIEITEIEFSWLKERELFETYEYIYQQQEYKSAEIKKLEIDYQPKSHHPYTLMGAICFERYQYSKGEYWFEEAIKRGANPRDMDSEIRRVVKNTKDENKRQEVVNYLLKKDPQRYSWAKFYCKNVKPIR
ncbi:hypothetical protein H6G33_14435 [Calothrix sp. FACHB-1219]|uniref:hypothetical protein n=1 Tax=unclassified Calothrix TaxID=2619626 RepID=UPI001686B18E|nr:MULTISPECIES: hypothetical protein [unclassified Calothrix]MBD2203981.1 hypothetical protein [Calothrix sp. FACHB-168]MBD2218234.1 hypothetical protein [Calothrix sp. FACHB-1219]